MKKPVDEDRMDVYAEITGTTAGYYVLTGAIDEYLNKAGDDELKEIVESAPRARARAAAARSRSPPSSTSS